MSPTRTNWLKAARCCRKEARQPRKLQEVSGTVKAMSLCTSMRFTREVCCLALRAITLMINARSSRSAFPRRASFQDGYWLEENGVTTEFLPTRTKTDSFVIRRWETELSPDLLRLVVMPPNSLELRSLQEYISYLKEQGRDSAVYQLALWGKIMQPLTIASLVLVAISFCIWAFAVRNDGLSGIRWRYCRGCVSHRPGFTGSCQYCV